jgi:Ca-activated chloride channel family protein
MNDDPKWTAYALGELDDAEREAIEAELDATPGARAFVTETREFGTELAAALRGGALELGDERRQAVRDAAVAKRRRAVPVRAVVVCAGGIGALAACFAVAMIGIFGAKHQPSALEQFAAAAPSQPVDAPVAPPVSAATAVPTTPSINLTLADPAATSMPLTLAEPVSLSKPGNERQTPTDRGEERGKKVIVFQTAPRRETRSIVKNWSSGRDEARGQPQAVPGVAGERSKLETLGGVPARRVLTGSGKSNVAESEAWRRQSGTFTTEAYDSISENRFLDAAANPLSTFSIDVDTASYANVRRFLNQGSFPPAGAVRIEEMINYFPYDYTQPGGEQPFSVNVEISDAAWRPEHRLVRVGLKGRETPEAARPLSNLVFLLDVSGSMNSPDKLPLLRESMKLLARNLSENDRVAIVVYAGASGLVLPSTTGDKRETIMEAIDSLRPGGSTNGAAGIQLAYEQAARNFVKEGINRVILATDGDFNMGVTNQSELVSLIEEKRKTGVFLSVLGFGTGNLKDSTMEKLADKGNGNYAYIDSLAEGRKVLVEQMGGTLHTIAKDVKIQVEFNPAQVKSYRLIGYENRVLAKEDFNDDKKDAGEIGAGHTVTALYEVVPAGPRTITSKTTAETAVDPLRYQRGPVLAEASGSGEMLTVKLRYKDPDGDTSKLIEFPVKDAGMPFAQSSRDFRFATAVAGFGMLLRDSENKANLTWDAVRELAVEGRGEDHGGYRGEFVALIDKAKELDGKQKERSE